MFLLLFTKRRFEADYGISIGQRPEFCVAESVSESGGGPLLMTKHNDKAKEYAQRSIVEVVF